MWWSRRSKAPHPGRDDLDFRGDRRRLHDGDRVPLPGYRTAREVLAEPTMELRPVPPPIDWRRPGRRRHGR